ncbi:hypothetical protein N431DRAFT_499509 [Stipitochalara longipes BDJ]|nr:hypothetical protein N431DRAFT_499509 [Stipitochalara longipes BDJ]
MAMRSAFGIENNTPQAMTIAERVRNTLSSYCARLLSIGLGNRVCETQAGYIEDYRPGYPRFSALIGAHTSFHICRRFPNLRARLALLKQDKLCLLEKQLNKIDDEENTLLSLGSIRFDRNAERNLILSDIDTALADYDALVERNHRMLNFEAAKPRDVLSLQSWVNGNACLARDETRYLTFDKELLSISSPNDDTVSRLECWVEDILIRFYKDFREDPHYSVSRDSNVYIFSGSLIGRIARTLILTIIIFLLLAPVLVCNSLSNTTSRIITIVISTIVFLFTISALTRAKTVETFLAGAT